MLWKLAHTVPSQSFQLKDSAQGSDTLSNHIFIGWNQFSKLDHFLKIQINSWKCKSVLKMQNSFKNEKSVLKTQITQSNPNHWDKLINYLNKRLNIAIFLMKPCKLSNLLDNYNQVWSVINMTAITNWRWFFI